MEPRVYSVCHEEDPDDNRVTACVTFCGYIKGEICNSCGGALGLLCVCQTHFRTINRFSHAGRLVKNESYNTLTLRLSSYAYKHQLQPEVTKLGVRRPQRKHAVVQSVWFEAFLDSFIGRVA